MNNVWRWQQGWHEICRISGLKNCHHMPELPDLEVFSHNLQRKLKGKTVVAVYLKNASKAKNSAAAFKKALEKQVLKKVYREGKELRIEFGNGHLLGLHLMLNGKLLITDQPDEQKHTIIALQFDDDVTLTLIDYQGIAVPSLDPEPGKAPDALSDELTATYLTEQLAGSRATVKSKLLDQHLLRGIGNAYADEILWAARISPFSISKALPEAKIKVLVKKIREVLEDAITHIKKHHPDIISGEVRDFMNIHQHQKDKSPTGKTILHKVTGGRKTYYTDEQELFEQ